MKYLFCVYDDGSQTKRPSIGERENFRDIFAEACLANEEALRESGYLIATAVLQSAITVWIRDGKVFLSDDPFTRTNEQLTGLFIINARDLNEAIQVAAKMPQARRGPIEVRPLTK